MKIPSISLTPLRSTVCAPVNISIIEKSDEWHIWHTSKLG